MKVCLERWLFYRRWVVEVTPTPGIVILKRQTYVSPKAKQQSYLAFRHALIRKGQFSLIFSRGLQ